MSVRTPGFTAELALQPDSGWYAVRARGTGHAGDQRVIPQRIPRYHCTSYDQSGCRQCCDLGGSGCYWQCLGDPILM